MRIYEDGIYRDATPEEIADRQNKEVLPVVNEITDTDRIEAMEAAILELAEVVLNG